MSVAASDEIVDKDELLLRQVHPLWFQDQRPSSCAFRPTPKDEGMLSVHANSLIDPETCHSQYVAKYGADKSLGVWAVSLDEVNAQTLKAYRDPLEDDNAHCVIDFTSSNKSQWEKISKKLRNLAHTRGVRFTPSNADGQAAA